VVYKFFSHISCLAERSWREKVGGKKLIEKSRRKEKAGGKKNLL